MKEFIKNKMDEIKIICANRKVRELSLFGSAIDNCVTPPKDLDFAVEFLPASPVLHADNYFGLLEDLEDLYGLPVDLIEIRAIRNPYFLKSFRETGIPLFHAA